MEPDPLPTQEQRQLLCEMLERAFIEMRDLGLAGNALQAADLADAFHNIPREMYDERVFSWDSFRQELLKYQTKWRPANDRSYYDYLGMLAAIRSRLD